MRRFSVRGTRKAQLLAATLLIFSAAFIAGTPAQAATAWGDCPQGYACFWTEGGGNGSRWDAPSAGCHHPLPSWLQDQISSGWNRGNGSPVVHMYNWTGTKWETLDSLEVGEQVSWASWHYQNDKTDRICIV